MVILKFIDKLIQQIRMRIKVFVHYSIRIKIDALVSVLESRNNVSGKQRSKIKKNYLTVGKGQYEFT